MTIENFSVVVVYHYPCVDGIFSALMAYLHFKDFGNVRYFPLTVYKEHTPEELALTGIETVYMLDIAGKPGFAVAIAALCKEVIVLDHHKTAMEDIGTHDSCLPNFKVIFDMDHSGATIARDYFKPVLPDNVAAFINMVEDGDLYKWTIPDSRAFYAYLQSLKLEYDVNKNPGIFDKLLALDRTTAVSEGARIMKEEAEKIDERLKHVFKISIGGSDFAHGSCLAVRGDGLEDLRSDMGNKLAKQSAAEGLRGISCVAYVEAALQDRSKIKLSFRAVGEEDTTTFIREFGGGGHAKASSCVIPLADFEAWKCTGCGSAGVTGDGDYILEAPHKDDNTEPEGLAQMKAHGSVRVKGYGDHILEAPYRGDNTEPQEFAQMKARRSACEESEGRSPSFERAEKDDIDINEENLAQMKARHSTREEPKGRGPSAERAEKDDIDNGENLTQLKAHGSAQVKVEQQAQRRGMVQHACTCTVAMLL